MSEPRLCVDMIIQHVDTTDVVLVERLKFPHGLALPGGGVDYMDYYWAGFGDAKEGQKDSNAPFFYAATRETKEETGLTLLIERWLPEPVLINDPRGAAMSHVCVGRGYGELKDEEGKTKVVIFPLEEISSLRDHFALRDHFDLIVRELLNGQNR